MKKLSVFPLLICLLVLAFLACDSDTTPINWESIPEEPTFVPANPGKGFHWGYYVYIPRNVRNVSYLLVEPNNTGTTSDDISVHDAAALNIIRWWGRSYADELGVVLLVPVFPRPASEWWMYTHALNRRTLQNNTGPLARIDLQLIRMIDDLRERCQSMGILLEPKFLMNGFSASGNFVSRFTAIHPGLVQAAAAGGFSLPIVPINTLEGDRLIYPIGIADLQEITGVGFNLSQYRTVPQFFYRGTADDNDSLPFQDSWGDIEREIIIRQFGWDILGRWEKSRLIHEDLNTNVQFVFYDGIQHTITNAMHRDIIAFLRSNMR
jgi:hypothetical protein